MRWLVLLAACTNPIEVKAPFPTDAGGPRWVVTRPMLHGRVHVATAGDAVYVLECGADVRVTKLVKGDVAWSQRVEPKCFAIGEHSQPIVASADGVVYAASVEIGNGAGVRIASLDAAGK